MKKLIFLIVIAFIGIQLKAQIIVDGVDINQTDAKYCMIMGTGKFLSNKVTIAIDYGQDRKFFSNESSILGPDGKKMVFNSMIDTLNFMEKNGWSFVDAYLLSESNSKVYHFLLKRNK